MAYLLMSVSRSQHWSSQCLFTQLILHRFVQFQGHLPDLLLIHQVHPAHPQRPNHRRSSLGHYPWSKTNTCELSLFGPSFWSLLVLQAPSSGPKIVIHRSWRGAFRSLSCSKGQYRWSSSSYLTQLLPRMPIVDGPQVTLPWISTLPSCLALLMAAF